MYPSETTREGVDLPEGQPGRGLVPTDGVRHRCRVSNWSNRSKGVPVFRKLYWISFGYLTVTGTLEVDRSALATRSLYPVNRVTVKGTPSGVFLVEKISQ